MAPLKTLVFDMDDTLYPEESYVRSGFQAVAKWLEEAKILTVTQAFDFMWSAHTRGERGKIFDGLLASCNNNSIDVKAKDLVEIYRTHTPNITLFQGIAELLDEAKSHKLTIAIISDGFLEAQSRKVEALQLSRWADLILLTDTWGREFWKPHPRAFSEVEQTFGRKADQIIYIGDNSKKDFHAPNQLGWHSIHLLMPNQLHADSKNKKSISESKAEIQVTGIQELYTRLFSGCSNSEDSMRVLLPSDPKALI